MKKKAIIVSLKGLKLSKKEKLLLSKEKPWGLILFKRNIKSFSQIKKLTLDIRKYAKDNKFPILIDEEGANVSRLSDIINHQINANFFGNIFHYNKQIGIHLYKTYLKSLCKFLRQIGININMVIDVLNVFY